MREWSTEDFRGVVRGRGANARMDPRVVNKVFLGDQRKGGGRRLRGRPARQGGTMIHSLAIPYGGTDGYPRGVGGGTPPWYPTLTTLSDDHAQRCLMIMTDTDNDDATTGEIGPKARPLAAGPEARVWHAMRLRMVCHALPSASALGSAWQCSASALPCPALLCTVRQHSAECPARLAR